MSRRQCENCVYDICGGHCQSAIGFPTILAVIKRAFPVSSANFWNSLPSHVTSAPSLAIFRQRLKSQDIPLPPVISGLGSLTFLLWTL